MDRYRDRVPVRTIGSGTTYDGQVWYELLTGIRSINGEQVQQVDKTMLKNGDRVTLEFRGKTYRGILDTCNVHEPASSKPGTPEKASNNDRRDTPPSSSKMPQPRREENSGSSPGISKRRASPRKRKLHEPVPTVAKRKLVLKKPGI